MYKQVIVVRGDIDMSRGKTAAQAAHASLGASKKADGRIRMEWEKEGGKKVVLKARDEEEMFGIGERCKSLKIPSFIVRDAGHTELPSGTVTAIGIGPDKEEKIDKVTGNLPLLE